MTKIVTIIDETAHISIPGLEFGDIYQSLNYN